MKHFQQVLGYTAARKFVIDNTNLIKDYIPNEIKANMIFIITCIKELQELHPMQLLQPMPHTQNEQMIQNIISLMTNILYTVYEVFDLNGITDNKLDYEFYKKEERVKNIMCATTQLDNTFYEINDSELLTLLRTIKTHVEYAIQTLVPEPKSTTQNILMDDTLVNERIGLIFSFVEEIYDFESQWTCVEICDILANLVYVLYDTFTIFNIDIDKAFDILHISNLNKFCKTEEIAIKSVKYYIHTKEYSDPQYMKTEYGDYYIIYNKSTNKILRSVLYQLPDFSAML